MTVTTICVEINERIGRTRQFFTESHFSAMTLPCWLRRAARNRHCHAIEQASRRWRGGRRGDPARTRRKILISTQVLTRRRSILLGTLKTARRFELEASS